MDSFPQFRTPDKKSRQRTESEASSNTDFNTVQGIASILKGKLVPGSYVSPKSGMIRTPEATPGREKMDKTDQSKNQVGTLFLYKSVGHFFTLYFRFASLELDIDPKKSLKKFKVTMCDLLNKMA